MSALQSHASDLEVLRNLPFFAGFREEHLKLVAIAAESRSLPEKLLLFDEGQLLHSAYVVVSGTLKAEHKVPNSDKVETREVGPGVILGERALILDARATESARVETRVRVLQIRKLMFRKLMHEHPEIAQILRSRFARGVVGAANAMNAVGERLRITPL